VAREHGCSISISVLAATVVAVLCCAAPATAQSVSTSGPISTSQPFDNPLNIPDVRGALPTAKDAEGVSVTLQILVVMTVLTLVPSILIMTTCFTRILVVLSLLRQAMATPQLPPGQVLLGLSLFMTLAVMAPTWSRVNRDAVQPYFDGELSQQAAIDRALGHMRQFMFAQIDRSDNHEDIYLFHEYTTGKAVTADTQLKLADVSTTAIIPAFILSELKTAFVMGFRIYLPFLVIDMVIASILISMGMMMLPPVLISLPFKILLFVLADGWHLVVQTLLYSFDSLA
jgi:flagellar biosynthesis protein FliP